MELAAVWWKDAHGDDSTWIAPGPADDDSPYVVLSVGYLLDRKHGRKRGHVSVARSVTCDGHIDAVLHIPRRMVLRVVNMGHLSWDDDIAQATAHPPSWTL